MLQQIPCKNDSRQQRAAPGAHAIAAGSPRSSEETKNRSMKNYLLLLAAAAETNTTNATKPWKLRNARRKNMTHWRDLKVALLYRGMHYGSYKSERHGGKFVRVNANHPTVIENHLTKIRRPLERAGATISTIIACTHQSDVVQAWLKTSKPPTQK